jgi:tetratricopeptide (TPR) repeat protein
MLARPKVRFLSLALAIAWPAVQCLSFQAAPSPEAKQRYSQARRLLALGEKDKAIDELKAVIQAAPGFIEAHRDYLDNQRDKAASFLEQYEGYVKQNPGSAVYHYLLGKAYSNANKREQADAEFKKALELDPNFGWAMLALSNTAARAGDATRSVELLEKASEHAGDSIPLRMSLGSSFLNKKIYDRALKEAERVLRLDSQEFAAYTTKWQARLSLTLGDEQTRAEVLREVQDIEARHGQDVRALLAAQSGYQMLDDEKGAARAKKAVLAIDPKYFERQPYSFFFGSPTGKTIQLTGTNARLFMETFSMKDEKEKLEAYKRLEASLDNEDAKLYALYPAMLRSHVALKDIPSAERTLDLMVKGNADAGELAGHRVTLARAFYESRTKLDTALDHAEQAVEQFRQPIPNKDGAEPSEYAKENAKNQLAGALHLRGQILLEKGMADKAVASLDESVKLSPQEDSLYDLGRAYIKLGRRDEAVDALSRAYAHEGKRQQEARASLQKVYGPLAKTRPLARLLSEAVDRHRAQVREAAIDRAVREITKTEAKQAPAFTLATLSGQKVQLGDLRGKVLLLNFWATW